MFLFGCCAPYVLSIVLMIDHNFWHQSTFRTIALPIAIILWTVCIGSAAWLASADALGTHPLVRYMHALLGAFAAWLALMVQPIVFGGG